MNGFILVLVALWLISCDQDPLANQPDSIRNGIPPKSKPEAGPPVSRDEIVIESNREILHFVEGEPGVVHFKGRVLHSEYSDFEISISDAYLPEGATFDPETGEFAWTPPKNFVWGDYYYKQVTLQVQVTTKSTPALKVTRDFPMWVNRQMERPEVLPVVISEPLKEGKLGEIKVYVRDLESHADHPQYGYPPVLRVLPDKSLVSDISSNVKIKGVAKREDPNSPNYDPQVWVYTLKIDLSQREVIREQNLYFGLKAHTHFGIPSLPISVRVPVINQVKWPRTTLHYEIESPTKSFSTHYFNILVPPEEHRNLKVEWMSDCKAKEEEPAKNFLHCHCETFAQVGMICSIRLQTGDKFARYKIKYRVINENPKDDKDVRAVTFVSTLRVRENKE